MKALIPFVLICSLAFSTMFAQPKQQHSKLPIITVTGEETGSTNHPVIKLNQDSYEGKFSVDNFTFVQMGIASGYDLESNGSTQQIWQDPNHPDTLHTIYMSSQQTSGWSDRGSTYIASTNHGLTWTVFGNVPAGIRSGFPSISGFSDGRPVVGNHSNRGKIYVDQSSLAGNFTVYDPGGPSPEGEAIWLRVLGINNNKVGFVGSVSGGTHAFRNLLTLPAGTFSGYNMLPSSSTAETYHLAKNADGSVIGAAYLGSGDDAGDVFYTESNDGGVTWTNPLKIWNLDPVSGTLGMQDYGPIRGVELTYLNNTPCVVFEIGQQDIVGGTYSPAVHSFIGFWNPDISSTPKIIADSVNVTEYPSVGTNDVMFPICRPVIGHSSDNKALFVAFHGATEYTLVSGLDATSYFAGYFMSSLDGGLTWTAPQKFTPSSPLRDWRYPSIAPVNAVKNGVCRVNMTFQSDTIPGSTVNAPIGYPVGVTAHFNYVYTDITMPVVPVELTNFTASIVNKEVQLNWSTATETNNRGFEIEKRSNSGWETVIFISGKGSTTEVSNYSWSYPLKNEQGKLSFRLKQIDYDGSYNYSNTVEVNTRSMNYGLAQNYPNPFNPSTVISYSIPQEANVLLKVYDALGNEVATLVNERKSSGTYDVTFNAQNLSNGVYFYSLKANDFTQVKKLVLIK